MTSELTFYQAFGVKGPEGQHFPLVGSIADGTTIEVDDTPHVPGVLIELAASETKLIYDYSVDGIEWDCLAFRMEEGYCFLACLQDTPTSTTNLAPSGAVNRAHPMPGLTCKSWYTLNSALCKLNATLNTDVGISGGLPTCLTDGASVQGRIYKIWAQNSSATDAAKIRKFMK